METHNNTTIFFYSARRRRKIFQIVLEKINFGPKIRVPPPRQNPKISFPSQNLSSPAKEKIRFPPPREIISEIFIPPQKFGVKSHYGQQGAVLDSHFNALTLGQGTNYIFNACFPKILSPNSVVIILTPWRRTIQKSNTVIKPRTLQLHTQ